MKFTINVDFNIADAEVLLKRIAAATAPVEIWLPRREWTNFFVDSWIVTILATSAHRQPLTVVDWVNRWKAGEPQSRFRSTLEGVAVAKFATDLRHAKGYIGDEGEARLDAELVRRELHDAGGRLEADDVIRSLTVCCLDDEAATSPHEPRLLSGLTHSHADFAMQFEQLFAQHLGDQKLTTNSHAFPQLHRERRLKLFRALWELYSNGHQYGARKLSTAVISGLRYVRMRLHKGSSASLAKRTVGFPELAAYINAAAPRRHNELLEISISDSGVGLIDRYVTERSRFSAEPAPTTHEERRSLLDGLLVKGLTESRKIGAGWGIDRALRNVYDLKGFMSMRTGEFWLYSSPYTAASHSQLEDVSAAYPLAPVRGTHYHILLPLTRGESA